MGPLQLYDDDQELQNIETYHLSVEKSDANLSCTPTSDKFVCSPAAVNMHRKTSLDHIQQSQETQQTLNKLCDKYKDILYLHQGNIGYLKLLTIDIDTRDHSPITQKP